MALIEPSVNNNTITKLNELKINVVDTYSTFNLMLQANKVNDNELYFILEERTVDEIVIPLTYHQSGYYYVTSADRNNLDLDDIFEHPERCILNIEGLGYVDINNYIYNSSDSVNLIAKVYLDIVSATPNYIANSIFYIQVLPNNSPYIDVNCVYGLDNLYPTIGKVNQRLTNLNSYFPILMSWYNSSNTTQEGNTITLRNNNVTINPYAGSINADLFNGRFNGNLNGIASNAYDFYYPKTITLSGSVSGSGSGGNTSSSTGWFINTTIVPANTSTIGGIRIGYSASGKNYAVQLNNNYQAYVNVPWTDTNIYHTTGTWNGFTYITTTMGSSSSADQLSMTLPVATADRGAAISNNSSGTSAATTVSPSDHYHPIELATGDNQGEIKIAGVNVKVKSINTAAYHSYYDFAERDHKHGFEIPITYNSTTEEYEISDSTITVQLIFDKASNCYISSSEYGYIETTYIEFYSSDWGGTYKKIYGKAYTNISYSTFIDYKMFQITVAPSRTNGEKLMIYVYDGNDRLPDAAEKVDSSASNGDTNFAILFHNNASPGSGGYCTPRYNSGIVINPSKQLISTNRLKVNEYASYGSSTPSTSGREAGELFFKLI